jgi:uncharacterized phage-associated protein
MTQKCPVCGEASAMIWDEHRTPLILGLCDVWRVGPVVPVYAAYAQEGECMRCKTHLTRRHLENGAVKIVERAK